jgi:hypothetical protein
MVFTNQGSTRNRGINRQKFWNTSKNYSKYPAMFRGNFCPANGTTGAISIGYQLPLCFGQFVFTVIFRCTVSVFVSYCYTAAPLWGQKGSPLTTFSSMWTFSYVRVLWGMKNYFRGSSTEQSLGNMQYQQSIYLPTNAINKIQLMTSTKMYMFRRRGAIVREWQKKGIEAQHISPGITLPILKCFKCCSMTSSGWHSAAEICRSFNTCCELYFINIICWKTYWL